MESRRDAFSLPPDLRYLNCAYMSPLARAVEEAGIRGIRRKRIPSAIDPEDFFSESDEVRRRFARIVGVGDPARIAIIPAASYGIAVAASNTPVEADQNVVIVHEQFPGNVYAWRALTSRSGAELRVVEPPPPGSDGRGAGWNARILGAIDADTAAVSLGHVHWTDGTLFDLQAVGRRAREVGAAFVVDGTQSVGALPFDVGEIRPDALVCAAYKWLLGPYSIGVAYYGPRYDGGTPLEETWIAREGSEDFAGLVNYRDAYKPGAIRYDVGERSNFILLPMLVEALERIDEWSVEGIADHAGRLTVRVVDGARELGFGVEAKAWRSPHIVGVRAPAGFDRDALEAELGARRVVVSRRGSAVRVSPHVYNDDDDVDALLEALRAASG